MKVIGHTSSLLRPQVEGVEKCPVVCGRQVWLLRVANGTYLSGVWGRNEYFAFQKQFEVCQYVARIVDLGVCEILGVGSAAPGNFVYRPVKPSCWIFFQRGLKTAASFKVDFCYRFLTARYAHEMLA